MLAEIIFGGLQAVVKIKTPSQLSRDGVTLCQFD